MRSGTLGKTLCALLLALSAGCKNDNIKYLLTNNYYNADRQIELYDLEKETELLAYCDLPPYNHSTNSMIFNLQANPDYVIVFNREKAGQEWQSARIIYSSSAEFSKYLDIYQKVIKEKRK